MLLTRPRARPLAATTALTAGVAVPLGRGFLVDCRGRPSHEVAEVRWPVRWPVRCRLRELEVGEEWQVVRGEPRGWERALEAHRVLRRARKRLRWAVRMRAGGQAGIASKRLLQRRWDGSHLGWEHEELSRL